MDKEIKNPDIFRKPTAVLKLEFLRLEYPAKLRRQLLHFITKLALHTVRYFIFDRGESKDRR